MVAKVTVPFSLQLRRGTTAENATYTGREGEITIDTELEALRVHDGFTPGGWEVTSAAQSIPAGGQTGQVLTKRSNADRDIGWQSILESGTTMIFVQPTAPTGWTKSTTHNNKALRIVSGVGGGSGGTLDFTSTFASRNVGVSIGDTALTIAQIPAHAHTITTNDPEAWSGTRGNRPYGLPSSYPGITSTGNTTGSGQGHTHTATVSALNMAVQYVDVIICIKD